MLGTDKKMAQVPKTKKAQLIYTWKFMTAPVPVFTRALRESNP